MSRPLKLKPPKPVITENNVEAACLDYLATRGYWTLRLHAGVYRTLDGKRVVHGLPKGTPDYAVLHPRLPGFLLEVKRPKAELSSDQLLMFSRLRACHIEVLVVESATALIEWVLRREGARC